MQSVASPKLAQAGQATAQPSSSMNPQAAQEAHALANASETLKAQAQTLKVSVYVPGALTCTSQNPGCLMISHPRLLTLLI